MTRAQLILEAYPRTLVTSMPCPVCVCVNAISQEYPEEDILHPAVNGFQFSGVRSLWPHKTNLQYTLIIPQCHTQTSSRTEVFHTHMVKGHLHWGTFIFIVQNNVLATIQCWGGCSNISCKLTWFSEVYTHEAVMLCPYAGMNVSNMYHFSRPSQYHCV